MRESQNHVRQKNTEKRERRTRVSGRAGADSVPLMHSCYDDEMMRLRQHYIDIAARTRRRSRARHASFKFKRQP